MDIAMASNLSRATLEMVGTLSQQVSELKTLSTPDKQNIKNDTIVVMNKVYVIY